MHNIAYGTETIEFDLSYTDRKTLEISVLSDASVVVVAPKGSSLEKIKAKVLKRGYWIVEQKRFFNSLHPYEVARDYVSGETHYYLGRRYRLKVVEDKTAMVKLKGKFFHVHTPDSSNTKKIKTQLQDWYKLQASRKYKERLALCYEKIKREGIALPKLSIRIMHKRWGSCTAQGITLNLNLIKAPVYCIDYVVMHELCHLKVPNHSPAFYKLKEKYMVDWKDRKKVLEGLR